VSDYTKNVSQVIFTPALKQRPSTAHVKSKNRYADIKKELNKEKQIRERLTKDVN
jgi:hypothetical protein